MLTEVALAVGLAALLHLLLRQARSIWLVVVPFALIMIPQLRPEWGVYWHGFLHSSFVYEIYERGFPPQNPLMVGEPLRYMYGHHALIAGLMRLVPIAPPLGFALTNAACLVLYALVVDRLARLASPERTVRIFAVFIAFFAASPLTNNRLGRIAAAVHLDDLVWTYIPLTKFVGINNNQIGWVLFALALLGLCRIAVARRPEPVAYTMVGFAVIASGYLYPPTWLAILACSGTAALYFFLRGGELRRAGLWLLVPIVGGAALTVSFVSSLTAGRSGAAGLRILPSFAILRWHVGNLAAFAVVPIVLLATQRRTVLAFARERTDLFAILALGVGVTWSMYLVMALPTGTEYKMLGCSVVALAVPLALTMDELHRKRPLVAVGLAAAFVFPVSAEFGRAFLHESVSDPVVVDGRWLRHEDPAQDSLYTWIARETPVDAVFVDDYLTIPVLGRRGLLIGVDDRRNSGALDGVIHDGWLISMERLLTEITAVEADELTTVNGLVSELLTPAPGSPLDPSVLEGLARYTEGKPVYVVARSDAARTRLGAVNWLAPTFQGAAATVFEVRKPGPVG